MQLMIHSNLLRAIESTYSDITRMKMPSSGVNGAPHEVYLVPIKYFFSSLEFLVDDLLQEPKLIVDKVDVLSVTNAFKTDIKRFVDMLQCIGFCLDQIDLGMALSLVEFIAEPETGLISQVSNVLKERTMDGLRLNLTMLLNNVKLTMKKMREQRLEVERIRDRYKRKARLLKVLLEEGIEYMGSTEPLTLSYENIDQYILFVKESFDSEDVFRNINYLLHLRRSSTKTCRAIVVDLDVYNEGDGTKLTLPGKSVIYHYKKKYLSYDVVQDKKNTSKPSFVFYDAKPVQTRPDVFGHLTMKCPGSFTRACSTSIRRWSCGVCNKFVEYGFNEKLYCDCGEGDVSTAKFQCSDYQHDDPEAFLRYSNLTSQLLNVVPLEEVNLLLVGQSGVGKSTWINGIVNYMSFKTLKQAEENELLAIVPTQFTIYDVDSKVHKVKVGSDVNENATVGSSATQGCRSYSIVMEKRVVRLIDTPGLGDTRGYEQDSENIVHIVRHLQNINQLHGICFLLKPNESRLEACFKYSLKELFCYLHKKASINIVFCFTNARSTHYKPGDSLPLLRKVLDESACGIQIDKNKIYCLDNEAFRFLCALKETTVEFSESDRESYGDSWEKSVKETKRLMSYIAELSPHDVSHSVTISNMRHRMCVLTQSLQEMAVSSASGQVKRWQAEVAAHDAKIASFRKDLMVDVPALKKSYFMHVTRVVCTNPTCTETYGKDILYKNICCDNCACSRLFEAFPNPELQSCTMMQNKICKSCNCALEKHMIINFLQDKTRKKEEEPNVRMEIDKFKQLKKGDEAKLKAAKIMEQNGAANEKRLLEFGIKLGSYLMEHSMILYNDDLESYLSYLISTEETKADKNDADRERIKSLNELKMKREAEDRIMEKLKGTRVRTTMMEIRDEEVTIKELPCYKDSPCLFETVGPKAEKVIRLKSYR